MEEEKDKKNENTEEFEAKSSISADLIRGHINTIILRSLYDRDKYGYEIINEINEKSHGQYTLKQPTLYSALKRLENQGYIQAYWKTDEVSAGGRRKYFRLTDSGREITEHNQAEWEYSRTVIDSLISDRNFDFDQPAPTPVDFKILKQATSRVPVVHTEGEEADDSHSAENRNGVPMLEARSYTVESRSDTVYIDDPSAAKEADESKNEDKDGQPDEEDISYSAGTETSLSYSEDKFHSGSTYSEERQQDKEKEEQPEEDADNDGAAPSGGETAADNDDTAEQTADAETLQPQDDIQPQDVQAADAREDIPVQPGCGQSGEYADRASSATEAQTSFYAEQPAYGEPSPSANRFEEQSYIRSGNNTYDGGAYERNAYTSQLGRSAEEEARRKVHENYLKLIADDDKKQPDETPYADSIDTSKLIYNARPEQERDYKNLIDKLFDNALKNTEPAPAPAPAQAAYTQPQYVAQPQAEEQAPQPVPSPQPRYNYFDASKKAASDGLKISTSDEAFAAGSARQSTYDKGATLFKCSLIVGVIMLLEFTLTLLFRTELNVGIAYPIVILALGVSTVLVCGILFGARYGSHIRKPTSLRYITTACIITVLLICIILLFAVILEVNWSVTTDVLAKVVIPCIIALNIPIFTLSFYFFIK